MDIQALTAFFKWCTIINGVMLAVSVVMFMVAPDFIYAVHGWFFALSRETFDAVFYGFLGGYKILFLVFNAVPFIALLIIGKKRTTPEISG